MLEVKFDGIVEFSMGSGQSKYESFEYTIKTARNREAGLYSHICARFAPMLIKADKRFKAMPFKRIQSLVITEVKELTEANYLIGKNILELDEKEVQDFACMYDLYEVPLAGTQALSLIREKALICYMSKVKKVPLKTPADKKKWRWFVEQSDGTFRFDAQGDKFPIQHIDEYFNEKKTEIKQKGIEELLGLENSSPVMAKAEQSAQGDAMPSASSLLNNDTQGISFSTP